jgi:hypothetical protein
MRAEITRAFADTEPRCAGTSCRCPRPPSDGDGDGDDLQAVQDILADLAWQLLRGGDVRARVRATRQGQVALRLHLVGAALDTGLLDALAERAATAADLARATGVSNVTCSRPSCGSWLRPG